MKRLLKQLVVLLILAGAAYYVWNQRYRIAGLSNNNIKIQGTWYQVEYDRKGLTPYHFDERIITANGTEWGSYSLHRNTELEVMVANSLTLYHLSFPDDESMLWSVEEDGKLVPAISWRE
jgi:uncharacterized protein YxeA